MTAAQSMTGVGARVHALDFEASVDVIPQVPQGVGQASRVGLVEVNRLATGAFSSGLAVGDAKLSARSTVRSGRIKLSWSDIAVSA
jgi:hypothetical protein